MKTIVALFAIAIPVMASSGCMSHRAAKYAVRAAKYAAKSNKAAAKAEARGDARSSEDSGHLRQ